MLPHVLRFNAPINAARQTLMAEALGQPGKPAALGLPATLHAVGVKPEQLDAIARQSMHDRWVHTNPRKIDGPRVVREVLDAAW